MLSLIIETSDRSIIHEWLLNEQEEDILALSIEKMIGSQLYSPPKANKAANPNHTNWCNLKEIATHSTIYLKLEYNKKVLYNSPINRNILVHLYSRMAKNLLPPVFMVSKPHE